MYTCILYRRLKCPGALFYKKSPIKIRGGTRNFRVRERDVLLWRVETEEYLYSRRVFCSVFASRLSFLCDGVTHSKCWFFFSTRTILEKARRGELYVGWGQTVGRTYAREREGDSKEDKDEEVEKEVRWDVSAHTAKSFTLSTSCSLPLFLLPSQPFDYVALSTFHYT